MTSDQALGSSPEHFVRTRHRRRNVHHQHFLRKNPSAYGKPITFHKLVVLKPSPNQRDQVEEIFRARPLSDQVTPCRPRSSTARLGAVRSRNCQSDSDNDREEPNAKPSDKKCGADHKHSARMANFPLVMKNVAFDNEKSES